MKLRVAKKVLFSYDASFGWRRETVLRAGRRWRRYHAKCPPAMAWVCFIDPDVGHEVKAP